MRVVACFSSHSNILFYFLETDVVEFEITIDKRKQKPIAINIIPTSPEIVGENRVTGAIAVLARQPQSNGVRLSCFAFLKKYNRCFFFS